jgi:hypothetical protein
MAQSNTAFANRFQNLKGGHHTQCAVETTPVGYRVQMGSHEYFRCTFETAEKRGHLISGGIGQNPGIRTDSAGTLSKPVCGLEMSIAKGRTMNTATGCGADGREGIKVHFHALIVNSKIYHINMSQ